MNTLDWAILVMVLVSTVLALRQGMLRMVLSFLGLVAGIVIAGRYYGALAPTIQRLIPQRGIAQAISFLFLAILVMILFGLVGMLLRRTAEMVGLGWADSLAGAFFGFLRGCLLVTAGMMAVAAFLQQTTWVRQSLFAPYFLSAAHGVALVVPRALRQQVVSGIVVLEHRTQDWLNPGAPDDSNKQQ